MSQKTTFFGGGGGWKVHHLMSYSRLLPLQSLNEIPHTRSNHSQSAFIHCATLFGHWKYLSRHEILKCCVSSMHWNYCTGAVFCARQTDRYEMNTLQYITTDYSKFLFGCRVQVYFFNRSSIN